MWKSKYISLLVAGLALSCGDEANSENSSIAKLPAKTYFVSASLVQEIPFITIQQLTQLSGQQQLASMVKYGVNTYKLIYQTSHKGEPINASGLLYIPKDSKEEAPLISLQHGTTFLKKDVPSVSGQFTGMELFAAAGYIAIMPDFIGYGESNQLFHPYYDEEHSAIAVIDMIKSAKEFLTKEKIPFNDKLFLAGYSEGGYVTLAATRRIESDPSHNLKVTAVAAGAGGYDLSNMLQDVTTNQYYAYPSYLAFVLMSYNTTYNWNKPLTYFFRDKYATALTSLMNGEYDGGYINSRLTTSVESLFNPSFFQRLKTSDGEKELKQTLTRNSVSGWKTDTPIRLYHGTADEIIPYQNSQLTLQNFKDAGSSNVSLTLIPKGTHGSSFVPMLQAFIPWFQTLK